MTFITSSLVVQITISIHFSQKLETVETRSFFHKAERGRKYFNYSKL
jgi:hypothetical protein